MQKYAEAPFADGHESDLRLECSGTRLRTRSAAWGADKSRSVTTDAGDPRAGAPDPRTARPVSARAAGSAGPANSTNPTAPPSATRVY